jgi:hypothetical protein
VINRTPSVFENKVIKKSTQLNREQGGKQGINYKMIHVIRTVLMETDYGGLD